MRIANGHLFPMAKFIVTNHMKKYGITLNDLIILNESDAKAAGYFQKSSMTICLNLGVLGRFLEKYEIEPGTLGMLQCATAVVFEECYHATHTGTPANTEEMAREYAIRKLKSIPSELLFTMGGEFHKTLIQQGGKTMSESINISDTFSITGKDMTDYINKVANSKVTDAKADTKCGKITIHNDPHTTKIELTTDYNKLNELKNSLGMGNAKITIGYTGLSYVLEDSKWTTYLDINAESTIVIEPEETVTVMQSKKETEATVEVSIN